MNRFDGKTVLVTGSDSGIGQLLLLEFAKEGASVVIHGISDKSIDDTASLLEKEGIDDSRYLKVKGFFNEDDKIFEELIEKTIEKFGQLDVLVNNSGVATKPGMDARTDFGKIEHMDFVWKINMRAPFALTELALPHLQKTKGCIINTCSVAGLAINSKQAYMIAYAASKCGLITMTKIQSARCAPLGVRVNGILPGSHETPLLKNHGSHLEPEEHTREYNKMVKITVSRIPVGVLGQPTDLIHRYLELAASSFISGALWVQDGGRHHWASELEYSL